MTTSYTRERLKTAIEKLDCVKWQRNHFIDTLCDEADRLALRDKTPATCDKCGAIVPEPAEVRHPCEAEKPGPNDERVFKHCEACHKQGQSCCRCLASPKPAGVWVRPGDEVTTIGDQGCFKVIGPVRVGMVALDHIGGVTVWETLGGVMLAPIGVIRTLSGQPVLGVRAGEFSETDLINAAAAGMNSVIFKQHKSLGEILSEIREARE